MEPVYMTDGLGSDFLASTAASMDEGSLVSADPITTCDPTALVPEPGCTIEEETEPDPEAPPSSEGSDSLGVPIATEPVYSGSLVANVCQSLTENPHLSTTIGYAGRINVKSRTTCAQPANLYAAVGLYREKCALWIFCSWVQIAYGEDRRFGTRAEAVANRDCAWQKGWYGGKGFSSASGPDGSGSANTYSPSVFIRCW
jgi:hypothetical protein